MHALSLSLFLSAACGARGSVQRERERQKKERGSERERQQQRWEKRRRGPGLRASFFDLSLSSSYYAASPLTNSFLSLPRFPLFLTLLSSPFPAPCSALSSPRSRRAACASRPCPPFPGALRRVSRSCGRQVERLVFSLLFLNVQTSLFADRTRALRGQSKPFYRPFCVFRRV